MAYNFNWSELASFLPGVSADADAYGSEYYDEALKKIDELYGNLDTTRKTAKQHYEAGREVAGMQASDKAGEAKKTAKASAMMNNAGKMTAAVQAAQAAADAANEGYDEAAQNAAALSRAQEDAEKNAEMSKAQGQASSIMANAQGKAQAEALAQQEKANKRNKLLDAAGRLSSSLLSFNK